jgi:hypothetical protein
LLRNALKFPKREDFELKETFELEQDFESKRLSESLPELGVGGQKLDNVVKELH